MRTIAQDRCAGRSNASRIAHHPSRREALAAALKAQGIPTAVYYRSPVHCQEPYRRFPIAERGAPVSERLSQEVISLPMHAYLDEDTQDRIIAAVRGAL